MEASQDSRISAVCVKKKMATFKKKILALIFNESSRQLAIWLYQAFIELVKSTLRWSEIIRLAVCLLIRIGSAISDLRNREGFYSVYSCAILCFMTAFNCRKVYQRVPVAAHPNIYETMHIFIIIIASKFMASPQHHYFSVAAWKMAKFKNSLKIGKDTGRPTRNT